MAYTYTCEDSTLSISIETCDQCGQPFALVGTTTAVLPDEPAAILTTLAKRPGLPAFLLHHACQDDPPRQIWRVGSEIAPMVLTPKQLGSFLTVLHESHRCLNPSVSATPASNAIAQVQEA